jgi:poly-gamma-glutamate system protein
VKRIYWRAPRISRAAVALIALTSLAVLGAVESLHIKQRQPWFEEKTEAAELTLQAFDTIRAEKAKRGIVPDPEIDPAGSGILGVALSPVTSNTGYLTAKRASVNPNFAAVLVHLLHQANVREGDLVAVGASGSFPALNMATFAAVQTLRLKPIVVASTSASQFGANNVGLLWIDMERILFEERVFAFRSVAASRGGIDDRGFGMSEAGRAMLDEAVRRNGLELIDSHSLDDAIEKRMRIYQRFAHGRPIKAYINIGGGSASVGTHIGKKLFKPGLNLYPPRESAQVDSVMLRFSRRGVPVIHITRIELLAERYDLDRAPQKVPAVGQGNVFVREGYNRWLAGAGIVVILLVMLAFLRFDVGRRILRGARPSDTSKQPQQMV